MTAEFKVPAKSKGFLRLVTIEGKLETKKERLFENQNLVLEIRWIKRSWESDCKTSQTFWVSGGINWLRDYGGTDMFFDSKGFIEATLPYPKSYAALRSSKILLETAGCLNVRFDGSALRLKVGHEDKEMDVVSKISAEHRNRIQAFALNYTG